MSAMGHHSLAKADSFGAVHRCMRSISRAIYAAALLHMCSLSYCRRRLSVTGSYACIGESDYNTAACVFRDLVYWRGNLYLVHDGLAETELAMNVSILNQDRMTPYPHDMLQDFVKAISQKELEQMLAGQRYQQKNMDRGLIVLWPHDFRNWWHTMDDGMSWGLRWCKYLGLCSYSEAATKRTAYLMYNAPEPSALTNMQLDGLQAPSQFLRCWSANGLPIYKKGQHGYSPNPEDLIVFSLASGGAGNLTMHPFDRHRLGQQQASPEDRYQLLRYIRSCAGVSGIPPEPPRPPALPRVVLINREYETGRGFLKLDEVAWRLQKAIPNLKFTIQYLEGLDFPGQVKLFSSADIVLLPHGAAVMNIHFLPMVSAVVDVNSWHSYGTHQTGVVNKMPPPYRILQYTLNMEGDDDTAPTMRVLKKIGVLDTLGSAEEKVNFLLGEGLHEGRGTGYRDPLRLNHKALNIILDTRLVVDTLVQAVADWQGMVDDYYSKRTWLPTLSPPVNSSLIRGGYASARTKCNGAWFNTEEDKSQCGACGVQCQGDDWLCSEGSCCLTTVGWCS